MDYKYELTVVPVSDVDRAKDFYERRLGFKVDVDHRTGEDFRVVQLTPPGSAASISIGTGISRGEPGSYQGMHLVVDDVEAARAQLVERGVGVSDVQDFPWGRFVFFSDPDGNEWAIQQVPPREES